MTNATKGKMLKATALAVDVSVPAIATLSQFPVWVERDTASTVSGLGLVLIALSCVPFYRQIRDYFKSPSAPVLWLVMFLAFAMLENIASEIKIVCFFGLVANLIGAGIYKLGENISGNPNANGSTGTNGDTNQTI